jgi:hypothetical protein
VNIPKEKFGLRENYSWKREKRIESRKKRIENREKRVVGTPTYPYYIYTDT